MTAAASMISAAIILTLHSFYYVELPAVQWHCEYGNPCVVYVRNDSSEKVSRYFAGDPICGR